jgi:hypothetical protein
VDGSFEFLVVGDPIKQLETAVENSKSGQVVISERCYQLIKDKCEATKVITKENLPSSRPPSSSPPSSRPPSSSPPSSHLPSSPPKKQETSFIIDSNIINSPLIDSPLTLSNKSDHKINIKINNTESGNKGNDNMNNDNSDDTNNNEKKKSSSDVLDLSEKEMNPTLISDLISPVEKKLSIRTLKMEELNEDDGRKSTIYLTENILTPRLIITPRKNQNDEEEEEEEERPFSFFNSRVSPLIKGFYFLFYFFIFLFFIIKKNR